MFKVNFNEEELAKGEQSCVDSNTLHLKATSQTGNPQRVEHAHTFGTKKAQCVFRV